MNTTVSASSNALYGARKPSGQVRFRGSLDAPWDVRLSRNQLLNRLFIESIGSFPSSLALARNKYERIEQAFAILSYLLVGIAAPLGLEQIFNKKYTAHLRKKYGLAANAKPLEMPFELLEHNGFQKLAATPGAAQTLAKYNIASVRQLTPALLKNIRQAKVQIILVDLFLMALKGQVFWFGKNWLTEKLSGKKGFSGEFKYASDAYLKKKSAKYDKQKKKRLIMSSVLGFGSAFAFTALMWAALKSKTAVGSGMMGRFKQLLPHFNYTNVIYMSKWLLLYETLFNYNLPKLASSRDSHEFRENLNKTIAFDFFYFFGDNILTGLAAKHYQKKYSKELGGTQLFKNSTVFGKNIPNALPLHQVHSQLDNNTGHLAYKLARRSFWVGLLGTTACLGITVPLVNMFYTKRKVLKEQSGMNASDSGSKPLKLL